MAHIPRPGPRTVEAYRRWLPLTLLLFALSSLAIPAPASAAQYATGTVNLNLYGLSLASATVPVHSYFGAGIGWIQGVNVSGILSISGDYQYVSTVTTNQTITVTAPGASTSGRAGNVTVSLSTGGASSTTVINSTQVSTSAAPIYLTGSITLYYKGANGMANATEPIEFSSGAYYVDESVAFSNMFSIPYNDAYYAVITITATSGPDGTGYVLAQVSEVVYSPEYGAPHNVAFADNIWVGVVALPVFNDTMLGAWIKMTPQDKYFEPPLPIGGLYNLMAVVGLIVLAFSAVFGFIPVGRNGRHGLGAQLANVAVGAGVILVFPYVYDRVAILMNYLDAYLIAYPGPYQDFLARLWEIQTNIILPPNLWNPWSLLTTLAFGIAYAVVWIIMWITIYLLGTVRILLIGAMLVMFPLSVALRDVPFTSKLGRMIEDTLFGIMLAAILSASMLSAASWLLANWNSGVNIFAMGGFQPQWVAIAAILGAVLAPTVLAPLTGTLFETTSEVAMFGGAVAGRAAFGGLSGGLGAVGAISGAGGGGGGAAGGADALAAGAEAEAAGAAIPRSSPAREGWTRVVDRARAFIGGAGVGAGTTLATEFAALPAEYFGPGIGHHKTRTMDHVMGMYRGRLLGAQGEARKPEVGGSGAGGEAVGAPGRAAAPVEREAPDARAGWAIDKAELERALEDWGAGRAYNDRVNGTSTHPPEPAKDVEGDPAAQASGST